MKKSILLFLTLLLMPIAAFAQEELSDEIEPVVEIEWASPNMIEGGVDCFDYYTFQSVSVAVSPTKNLYQPGEMVDFTGMITNENTYPVVDGNLYVRISEDNDNYFEEGRYVIDEFFALENVALNQESSQKVNFSWEVPVEMSKGNYHVDYFFSVGKKFNLGGLPFSNEVVAGTSRFEADSVNEGFFSFDRSGTAVNGEAYQQIGNWPIVKKDVEVVITHNLKNTMDYDTNAIVTFDLYFWDSLLEEDKITSEQVSVNVVSGGSQEISYTIPSAVESVYYLKTTAEQGDLKSVVNTRFVVEDNEHARLNYPSVTQFPIKKGDNFTLFSCFHNTSYTSSEGIVMVKISDESGNQIAQAEYNGAISSAMNAIKEDIKAEEDYDYLKLYAEVKDQDGNIIDQYETEYSCEQFDNCEEQSITAAVTKNPIVKWVVYSVLAVIIVIVLMVIIKIARNKKDIIALFFIICGAMVIFGNYHVAEAGKWSVSSSKNYTHGSKKSSDSNSTIFQYTVASGNVTLHNDITGNSSTTCGGSTAYTYTPVLTFSANGGYWDTPYGYVCSGSSLNCFGNSQRQNITDTSGKARTGYVKWISQRPSVSLSSSNNSVMSCSGMTCTAKPGKSGTVTITASFSGVTSQIYSNVTMKPCHGPGESCPGCSTTSHREWFSHSPSNQTYGVTSGCIKTNYHSRMYYSGSWHNGTNRMSLPAKSVSWNVTVASCATDGVCGAAARTNYPYTATGPSTPLCSAGTTPSTVSNFSGYGAASEVTWTCGGTGGGSDSPVCRAQRVAPPLPVCGTRHDKNYTWDTTIWPAGSTWCARGSHSGGSAFPGYGSRTNWTCSFMGKSTPCYADRQNPPICTCNSSVNGHTYSYLDSAWPAGVDFCQYGDPVGGNPLFPGSHGGSIAWDCGGVNCTGSAAPCSAARGNPDPCACGTANRTTSDNAPSSNLCEHGNASSVLGVDVWSWTCGVDYDDQDSPPGANNGVCIAQASCEADCIDPELVAPSNVYVKDGETNTVEAKIRINGNLSNIDVNTISCTINGSPVTFLANNNESEPVDVSVGSGILIESVCEIDVDCGNNGSSDRKTYSGDDMNQSVTALCMQRSCNAQGTCQATPQSASSGCTSTCSSDADCSRGRMIETRP